jgi:flagellar hook assembly protein FlgD
MSIIRTTTTTGVTEIPPPPLETTLMLAGRMPALGQVRFRFSVPRATQARLEVLDVTGRRVRNIDLGRQAAGWHDVRWEGDAEGGGRAAPGVYFVRLITDEARMNQRVVLLN